MKRYCRGQDVVEATRELAPPMLRWGGMESNRVGTAEWMDGWRFE